MKATVEVEVPTEFVERRLASIEADIAADHAAGGPAPEPITAEQFFAEVVWMEVGELGGFLGRDETELRVEIVRVER